MSENSTIYKVRIIGYCELGESETLAKLHAEGPDSLRNLRGEYALVIETNNEIFIIISPLGAMSYFYTVQNGKLYHSDKLVEIIAQSGLGWEWDWRALGDVCNLDHLMEDLSLHQHIKKVPSGSVLHFKDGKLKLESRLWIDSIEPGKPDPDEALNVLNDETSYWAGDNPCISLSGGLDSRVILSSLLKQGIRPHLMTRGHDKAFDVIVARQIAAKFGLKLDVIKINLDDFITHASDISALTNGSMSARHWHSYLYPQKAGLDKSSTLYVGALGEFVRAYPFDYGFLTKIASVFPEQPLHYFWNKNLRRLWSFTDEELEGLAPEFRAQLDLNGRRERSRRLVKFCHHKLLSGGSRWFLEQRNPNFAGIGAKMYLASTNWVSPFHSTKWIEHVWRLGDRWKLGSNWHRYAVQKNFPELLEFQEKKGAAEGRILPRAPLLYWTSMRQRVPYKQDNNLAGDWYRSDIISQFLIDNSDEISDIINLATVNKVHASHVSGNDRTRVLGFLLSMIYWKMEVKKASRS